MERGERFEMNSELGKINNTLDNVKQTDAKDHKVDIENPVKVSEETNIKKIDTPEIGKNISAKELNPIDRPIEIANKCYTTYKQRFDMTPVNNGEWIGKRGESIFKTYKSEVIDALKIYGKEGIEYTDCQPDFSPVAEKTVEIEMTEFRYSSDDPTGKTIGNFEKADDIVAKEWNKEKREGRDNWSGRDVATWRKKNNYVWHECNDMKTCHLISEDIHKAYTHIGGCKECELRDHPEKQNGISDVNDVFDK